MDQRLERLLDYFRRRETVAVAFSGGVDSSLVLWAAGRILADRALGVTVRSEFICSMERQRAERMGLFIAGGTGARVIRRDVAVLPQNELRANPPDRCYLCKRIVLAELRAAAREILPPSADLAEGTNDDDDPARPGRRAVAEAGCLSPLAECGLTKADVRELARRAGLPNADDPANSCLATRVPSGHELTYKRLVAIEGMERAALDAGLIDLRARLEPEAGPNGTDAVRLLVRSNQLMFAEGQRPRLAERARFLGFGNFSLGMRQ